MACLLAIEMQLDTVTRLAKQGGLQKPVGHDDQEPKQKIGGLVYKSQLDIVSRRASRVTGWVPRSQWIDLRKPVGHGDWIGQARWPNGLWIDP